MMTSPPVPPEKINFAGMVGAKRRRMRSGGNVSALPQNGSASNSISTTLEEEEEKIVQTSKCKGATTIPIFLKKTYKMIDTCDDAIAAWTEDGEMFVVKDPDAFAEKVIPQYFDHNKFSSFARQLNFYGFRKMQSKPIRNVDYDAGTAKHVTFYNENFKRGRCDLLKKIQRSTRGGGTSSSGDHAKEIQELRNQVSTLEETIATMGNQMEERMRRLELDMLSRMEQMMLAMQTTSANNNNNSNNVMGRLGGMGMPMNGIHPSRASSNTSISVQSMKMANNGNNNNMSGLPAGWDPLPFGGGRGNSIGSLSAMLGGFQAPAPVDISKLQQNNNNISTSNNSNGSSGGPTLPPHPKMKQLPTAGGSSSGNNNAMQGGGQTNSNSLPTNLDVPPVRLNSLRGFSNLSRGISNLSRGASIESIGSTGGGPRNAWEDKFFSMLMSGDQHGAAQQLHQNAGNNNNNGNNEQQMLSAQMSNHAV